MSKPAHTPGTWRRNDPNDGRIWVYEKTGDHTSRIKIIARDVSEDNAPLMSAAPDLLEALTGLATLQEGYCVCFGSVRDALKLEHEHTGECRAARAAIKKAGVLS